MIIKSCNVSRAKNQNRRHREMSTNPPQSNDEDLEATEQERLHSIESYIQDHDEMLQDSEDFAGFEY